MKLAHRIANWFLFWFWRDVRPRGPEADLFTLGDDRSREAYFARRRAWQVATELRRFAEQQRRRSTNGE